MQLLDEEVTGKRNVLMCCSFQRTCQEVNKEITLFNHSGLESYIKQFTTQ